MLETKTFNDAEERRGHVHWSKRLVMCVWWWRPWNIVHWIYAEEGPDGHAVLVKQGTTYLWRILITAAVVWLCNLGLWLVGFDNHKATLGIYDA